MKRLTFYLLFLPLVTFAIVGCASRRIETSMTTLNSRPSSFKGAHVALDNIRFYISGVPAKAQTGTAINPGGAISGTVTTPSIVVIPGDPKQATFTYNLLA